MRNRLTIVMAAVGLVSSPITWIGGCAAPPAVEPTPQGSAVVVEADWDDVEPAAAVAAGQAEVAILDTDAGDEVIRFRLRTIGGEPGELRAERVNPAAASGPIRLTARLGLFGEPKAEQRLLQAMAKRLRQLAGVEWAPL